MRCLGKRSLPPKRSIAASILLASRGSSLTGPARGISSLRAPRLRTSSSSPCAKRAHSPGPAELATDHSSSQRSTARGTAAWCRRTARAATSIPDLAESWEILRGQSAGTGFICGKGVTFHDGRPLLGRRRRLDTFQSDPRRPASRRRRRAPSSRSTPSGIEAVDEHTVDLILSEPYGAHARQPDPLHVGIVPDGSERPTTFNRSSGRDGTVSPRRAAAPIAWCVEAFEGYYRRPPIQLDRVIFRDVPDATVRALELQKGSVHLVDQRAAARRRRQLPRRPSASRVVESPGSNYAYVGIQMEDPVLSRAPQLRLSHRPRHRPRADRELHLARASATVTETMMRPGHWARNDDARADPLRSRSGSKRLLDEAGFPRPRRGRTRSHDSA